MRSCDQLSLSSFGGTSGLETSIGGESITSMSSLPYSQSMSAFGNGSGGGSRGKAVNLQPLTPIIDSNDIDYHSSTNVSPTSLFTQSLPPSSSSAQHQQQQQQSSSRESSPGLQMKVPSKGATPHYQQQHRSHHHNNHRQSSSRDGSPSLVYRIFSIFLY